MRLPPDNGRIGWIGEVALSAADPGVGRQLAAAPPVGWQVTWGRWEEQLGWYDRRRVTAQRWYKRWKLVELVVAAALPVVAGLHGPVWVTGSLGGLVVLEAMQHLYQFQANWITYRSTAEALKHERYLYLAQAGPYAGAERDRVLAGRLEGLISQEHATWTEGRQQPDVRPAPAGGG